LIAIGDIHGFDTALAELLKRIAPQPNDTIVTLGDVVDRGPDSDKVIERLIALATHCNLVSIRGNHDDIMLTICDGGQQFFDMWLTFGGAQTCDSYGKVPKNVPEEHIEFLRGMLPYYETKNHFFTHGNYWWDQPLEKQNWGELCWQGLSSWIPRKHISGKTAIVGHSSQKDGKILRRDGLICIDTGVYCGGPLTAMEVNTGQLWQVWDDGSPVESWFNPEKEKGDPSDGL